MGPEVNAMTYSSSEAGQRWRRSVRPGRLLALAGVVVAVGACGMVQTGRGNTSGDPPRVPLSQNNPCGSEYVTLQEARKTPAAAPECERAYSFVRRCGDKVRDAVTVETELCASALTLDMNAAIVTLRSSVTKSDVAAAAPSEFWPKLNVSGAPVATYHVFGATLDGTRMFGVSLARLEELKPTDPKSVAVLKAARALRDDTIVFERDTLRLAPTCEAIDGFEKGASAVGEVTAGRYRLLARQQRDGQIRLRRDDIKKRTAKEYTLGEVDLSVVRRDITATRALPTEMRCYDIEAANATSAEVETWAKAMEKAVSEEETCRATPACMGARIAGQLCPILVDRRETAAQIAAERRNPGGVVNLATLHDLGEKLQYADAMVAKLKSEYATAAKKPFTEGACSR